MRQPSTEREPSFQISYRRADVMGFWTVVLVLIGVVTTVAALILGARAPWAWGLAGTIALVAPRLVRQTWFEDGIWFWNGCTRRAKAGLRRWILMVAYFIVITVIGRAGSSIDRRSRGAEWLRRDETTPPSVPDLAEFCRREHLWALVLMPVLSLLAVLEDVPQDAVPPSTTYTLY
jgi:hypothetical protein